MDHTRRNPWRLWLAMVIAGLCAMPAFAAQTVIIQDGQPRASIVIAAKASANEKLAAQELQTHLQLMSGATLPIVTDAAKATGVPIYIGSAAPSPGLKQIRQKSTDKAALRLSVTSKTIELTGNTDVGTLDAAYELLEQLGVRWLIPGPLGVDVPKHKTVAVEQQELIDAPAFRGRILQAIHGDWPRRQRLGGLHGGGHGLGPNFNPKKNPEFFYHGPNGKPLRQAKVSDPAVLKAVIAYWRKRLKRDPGMKYIACGPKDGMGFGQDPWDANDFVPLLGVKSATDRYIKFYNLVLANLQKDYPNVGLSFYAYVTTMRPPVREKPNAKILPMIAPIAFDRFHAITNPRSWEMDYLRKLIEGWQDTGVKLMMRGYLFNLADFGLPFSMIDIVKKGWPYYYDHGLIGMRMECLPNWGYHAPALYLACKLYWHPHADADAIVNDWFKRMYGPAADAMKAHFDLVENAYINADYYTGNVFDVPHILTPEVRQKMGETLAQAEKLAGHDTIYAKRIKLVRIAYDYGEAGFKMMHDFDTGNFTAAEQDLNLIRNKLYPLAIKQNPPVLRPTNKGYLKRFFGRDIDNAYQRVTNGREVAVHLPDVWHFFLDPNGAGEELFLYQPELGVQSWRTIHTWSQSTSDQGLRYYHGTGWYRCKVTVPAKFAGRKLRAWFGGIDDMAKVWINGKPLTLIHRGSAPIGVPWEFDATEAVKVGKENVIVVEVSDTAVNEIGTFGITGPAMIWAEPAGK